MRRESKRVLTALAFIALPVIVVVLVFVLAFDPSMLRNAVAERISTETGREFAIDGDLRTTIGLWPRVTAGNARFANPDWATGQNMLEIPHLEVTFDLLAFLRGRWIISDLLVRGASIRLERDQDGRQNWDLHPGSDRPQWTPEIRNLVIEDSRLRLVDRPRDLALDASISVSGPAGSDESTRFVTLQGTGRLRGEAFELTMRGGSLLALGGQHEAYPLEVDVRVGETAAKLSGTVREPMNPVDMNMKLQIAGPNAALLAPILDLPLPGTRPYELSGDLVREPHVWRFEDFSGVVGESDLAGSISIDLAPERPLMVADLVSTNVEAEELGPLIGLYPGVTGSGGSDPAMREHVLPDAPLQREQIQNTDARVKFAGKRVVAPRLPLLQDVELDLELDDGVLRLSPLRFGFKGGTVTLFTSLYSKAEPVRTDLDLRLSALHLQNVLDVAGLDGTAEGTMEGRVKLSTEGDNVRSAMATAQGQASLIMERGRVAGSTLALLDAGYLEALAVVIGKGEPEPMIIQCVAAGFNIEGGTMVTHTAVLDSENTLITGEGTIDLGKETLMLRIRGRPKSAGIGHTRVPVKISGRFAAPSATLDTSEVALRGGLALGIGVLVAPVAAILPFIDLGLAEDSDCVKYMKQATEGRH